jgi:hypothetical protein
LARLKPKVTWKPPEDFGQFELSLSGGAPLRQSAVSALTNDDPRMPAYIDNIALRLEELLVKSDLYLWLMVDRLDEPFARRSDTETRALRGLLRTLSLFRSDRIRVKVFLRDDILDQIVAGRGFTALTHVTARSSDTLRWSEEQILTMIVRRIFAHLEFSNRFEIDPTLLRSSIEYQRQQFYKIFVATSTAHPIRAERYVGSIITPKTAKPSSHHATLLHCSRERSNGNGMRSDKIDRVQRLN